MVAGDHRIRAYVGLGGNVGDAGATLAWAVQALAARPGIRLRAVSPLYATAPWGVTDQAEFRNAAAALEVRAGPDPERSALALLVDLKDLERAAGREAGPRWGPRPLDLDLLLYGRHMLAVERPDEARSIEAATDPGRAARLLEVPHRELAQRLFVLAPLADLVPRLVPPGWHETIETTRRRVAATEGPDAVRMIATWDVRAASWRPI